MKHHKKKSGWLQRQLGRVRLHHSSFGVSALHDGGYHAYGEETWIIIAVSFDDDRPTDRVHPSSRWGSRWLVVNHMPHTHIHYFVIAIHHQTEHAQMHTIEAQPTARIHNKQQLVASHTHRVDESSQGDDRFSTAALATTQI